MTIQKRNTKDIKDHTSFTNKTKYMNHELLVISLMILTVVCCTAFVYWVCTIFKIERDYQINSEKKMKSYRKQFNYIK